ncbi:hypothetical protein [Bradyrhizobium sp. CCBAU 45384]|uniref:hypothetical protein n=1 Tax=Bradyrhizobium sp. CCBAU 45384 TaxID=858428 RepID=UPI002305DC8B|nr:hypothetical protein [Bradyrhizobium sp. CCBAU 45384]
MRDLTVDESMTMREIAVDELEVVSGGENCTYASQSYSPGSVIKMGDGNSHVCKADGTWN